MGIDGARHAVIGSTPGETLEVHIEAATKEGCQGVDCVSGWDSEGDPIWEPFLEEDTK
jgi:hypothetical protein